MFYKQIMHIRRWSLVKLSTLGNFIKIQNTLGFQPRVFSDFYKVGWIILTITTSLMCIICIPTSPFVRFCFVFVFARVLVRRLVMYEDTPTPCMVNNWQREQLGRNKCRKPPFSPHFIKIQRSATFSGLAWHHGLHPSFNNKKTPLKKSPTYATF